MFGSKDSVLSIPTHVILKLLQGRVTVGREQKWLGGSWGLRHQRGALLPSVHTGRFREGYSGRETRVFPRSKKRFHNFYIKLA